jgi:hypothetical protein
VPDLGQKSIVKKIGGKMALPLASGVMCLSTPKYNGKFGTGCNILITGTTKERR